MWPINYDSFSKFHMSVGSGLLVASFILLISNSWLSYDKLNQILEEINDNTSSKILFEGNKTATQIKIESFGETRDKIRDVALFLYIVGTLSFMLGYMLFIYNCWKRKKWF